MPEKAEDDGGLSPTWEENAFRHALYFSPPGRKEGGRHFDLRPEPVLDDHKETPLYL